jgi:hypothetical protein
MVNAPFLIDADSADFACRPGQARRIARSTYQSLPTSMSDPVFGMKSLSAAIGTRPTGGG